jgi:hypothetical protein
VRQYRPDEYSSRVEVYRGNQAQFVAADVKHKQIADFIGTWKECAQDSKVMPLRFFAQTIPLLQRTGALRMRLLCSQNSAMSNYVHVASISQKEILVARNNLPE